MASGSAKQPHESRQTKRGRTPSRGSDGDTGGRAGGEGTNAVDPALSFEDAMTEVESIIEQIDRGEIGLEASLDAWERGMRLLRHCREMLDRAEQRVQEIKLSHQGGVGAGVPDRGGQARNEASDDEPEYDVDPNVDAESDGPGGIDDADIPF